jgi:ribosomal protein S18 acetylase RimI-like enzyme
MFGVTNFVRRARAGDADDIAQLLHAFNTEFDEPTPPPDVLAQRLRRLMGEDTDVLLVGDGPDGLALMRFRPSLWTEGLECYLGELYVVPALRGNGLGRALMEAAIALARERGADYMELNTDEGDVAAHALYRKLGLRPTAAYYEREL